MIDRDDAAPTLDSQTAQAKLGTAVPMPVDADATQASPPAVEATAKRDPAAIGPYRLVKKIGEGGMGQVWLAEQSEPVRRQVALKLIKVGMYDDRVLKRFQAERQSLAIMDHPAIAKVFDAGSAPDGQPYFVMEYVPGLPLTDYCDQKKMSIRERLELFIKVCDGVQHAHLKAIIHRDLKPANILVAEVDGKPLPRIIDFGLAKATTTGGSDETMFTMVGAVVGTLGYMSPEQADSDALDVDTRTDVYSLGVVLYVLLTGCLCFDSKKGQKPLLEVLRQLREDEPPRPSTRVGLEKESSSSSANMRGVQPRQLVSLLQGDLDWITMKALEKDRGRRYGTPFELAADIARYLRNEPVVARPASPGYRLQKYVRRHRVAVAVVSGLVLLLAAFVVTQGVQLRRTTRERDRANRERDRATRVTDFMSGMFKVSDPSEARGNDIRAREILDKASTQIDAGLAKDPELQAQMMTVMGEVYKSLGLYPQAEGLMRRAIDIRSRVLGENAQETLQSRAVLADILDDESRFPEAEKAVRETLAAQLRSLGPEHGDTLDSTLKLGSILADEGRYDEAAKLHQAVLESAGRMFGPQDTRTTSAARSLAIDFAYQNKYPEAEKAFREVLELQRKALGPDDPVVLNDIGNLASMLLLERKYADAEKLYREALDAKIRVLGPEHPETLLEMGNLALAIQDEKRYPEAEKLFRQTLAIKRNRLGPEHRSTVVTLGNLADLLLLEGKYPEAEQLLRQALEMESRTLGREHSDTLNTMQSLGELLTMRGNYPEASNLLLETYNTRRRVLGRGHEATAETAYSLAKLYALEGRRNEAFTMLGEAIDHGLSPGNKRELSTEPELKSLHGDPRFDTLVADARERAG